MCVFTHRLTIFGRFLAEVTWRFYFLLGTPMIESLTELLQRSRPTPLPTYLGGEKQRTCLHDRIWNISDGAVDRTRKVCRGIFASTSILWSVRSVLVNLGRSTDVYFTRSRPLTAYTPSRSKKISTVKPTKKAVLSPWRLARPTYLPRHVVLPSNIKRHVA